MRTEHPSDEKDETVWFTFNDSANGYIELNLNMPQERPYTGWTIAPHKQPLRVGIEHHYLFYSSTPQI